MKMDLNSIPNLIQDGDGRRHRGDQYAAGVWAGEAAPRRYHRAHDESSGARAAFEAIVETHHAEIYRYLRVVLSRGPQAERLLQETFLRAFRGHRSLPAEADVRAWLFGIASTLCRTDIRSGRRYGPRPEDRATRDEARSRLKAVIQGLPVTQRLAVTMRKLHDLDYDAIGASLDCAAETARAHVLQALRQIRCGLDGLTAPGQSGGPGSAGTTGRTLTSDRMSRGMGGLDVGFGVGRPSRAAASRRGA
jgi:RNA polymerase sigma factor (sigma-70 family)